MADTTHANGSNKGFATQTCKNRRGKACNGGLTVRSGAKTVRSRDGTVAEVGLVITSVDLTVTDLISVRTMAAEEEADVRVVGTTAPPVDKESARVKPYCPITIEPIVFFLVLSLVMVMPLQQQYIYYKLGNDTLPSSSRCDVNTSHPASKANQKVAAESANWLTYIRLCVSLPSLLMVLVLGSLSDRLGRKVTIIAPIIGTLIWLLLSALVVYLDLPLAMFLIGSFVFGMMGGSASFITGCTAYIADITGKGKSREVRLAIAGSAAGVAGAVVGVAYVMSVLGIKVLGRWLSSYGLVQVGCVSAISGLVLQALAVYTSNHTMAFFIGSLFALAAFLDNIGDLVFVPFLNFLYAETLSVMPGLVLLVCAGIYLMCSILIGVHQCNDSPTGYESIPQGINEDLE
ncbi:SLC46A3 [Branchiostoma lanceolatum]|uniref:SLC46A3 protein n=1 Tax=Branchiostoma lanceolatum TaxID=7740 RepID=A0A8K0A5V0_BRALA|nr:SLC46A3 [Branchiostoma lanceolatum]